MNDRELLELAAKAADLELFDGEHGDKLRVYYTVWHTRLNRYAPWNPLTDDGDALRLAVKLGINGPFRINWGYGAVSTEIPAGKCVRVSCEDMEVNDPLAATRRAIVRAAAEIGKGV